MKKIKKNTKFNEIFEDEGARRVLEERGMHCLGCPFASMESIEQGAKAHGLDADELVKELNKKKRGKKVKGDKKRSIEK
ncbi:MAG: DUF1858 domain-containing protein [Nanoarchaeota archaeon]|nr:DUF1858 domain-containing protein [Nanoarchaeota archaeon]